MADARQGSIVDRLKERAAEVNQARGTSGADTTSAVAGPAGGPDKVLDSILPAQHLACVPIDLVSPAPEGQARQDFDEERLRALADSLRRSGVREPIIVTPHGAEKGRFLIIAGERRWRAAKLAGLAEIPCLVDPSLRDRKDKLLAQAEENFHREDLNPVEEAAALAQLMEARGVGPAEAGELLGKSVTQARRLLQLHEAPACVKDALAQKKIDARAALELVHLHNKWTKEGVDRPQTDILEQVRAVLEKAIAERWSTRRLERFSRGPGAVPGAAQDADAGNAKTPGTAIRHLPRDDAKPSRISPVRAVVERSEERVVIDVARIRDKALTPQEREALIDLLEDLLILVRSG